jgi:aldehyde dehydrogenase (NAD+)
MILKPSEIAPLSASLFTQILHEAGLPPGVFNMVNGDGSSVGSAISSHPDVAMISFTGSTRAGIAVASAAAPTVKRVTQELGGKSANILLDDADLESAVKEGVQSCFRNTGQSCNAPTRMLVPRSKMAEVASIAKRAAEATKSGDPFKDGTSIGPLASKAQFEKVQGLITKGIEEGANLIAGGPGRPEGTTKGYYVKPTVFADVQNDMAIAREEIFGPVLCILPYDDEDHAIRIANDTLYGLSGYVTSGDIERARRVAKRIRSGNVHINGARLDFGGCFGGRARRILGVEGHLWLRGFNEMRLQGRLRSSGARRPAKPNLPPIDEFAARTTAECHVGTSAEGTFQVNGVAELPHLSCPIHNQLVDPPGHLLLFAGQQTHVRRKP